MTVVTDPKKAAAAPATPCARWTTVRPAARKGVRTSTEYNRLQREQAEYAATGGPKGSDGDAETPRGARGGPVRRAVRHRTGAHVIIIEEGRQMIDRRREVEESINELGRWRARRHPLILARKASVDGQRSNRRIPAHSS